MSPHENYDRNGAFSCLDSNSEALKSKREIFMDSTVFIQLHQASCTHTFFQLHIYVALPSLWFRLQRHPNVKVSKLFLIWERLILSWMVEVGYNHCRDQYGVYKSVTWNSLLLLLLKWLYSPMRTLASFMDFSQSSQSIWLFRGHILGFLTVDFFRGGVVMPTPNPQPRGPGLHIYIPWRLGGPVIPPGTEYPF
jgi:hypothetical protein